MKRYRASKASAEEKEQRNEYKKKCRESKSSPEKKAKRNGYQKKYKASKASAEMPSNNMQFFISKFHEVVSQGPLYVSTCCDQLCYKHSML